MKLTVISDGTPNGTRLVCADTGEEVELVTRLETKRVDSQTVEVTVGFHVLQELCPAPVALHRVGPRTLKPGDRCYHVGCDAPAVVIARNPDMPEARPYCEEHAEDVAGWQASEYQPCCPNCGCKFPVG